MNKSLAVREVGGVCTALRPAREKWERIGLALGITRDTIQQIKIDKKNEPGACLYAIVNAWVRQGAHGTHTATWRTLLRVLESPEIGEAALANQIKKQKGFGQFSVSTIQESKAAPPPAPTHKEKDESVLGIDDLSWLLSHTTELASNWQNFGVYLKVPYKNLRIIKVDNPSDSVSCLRETLVQWLEKNPTCEDLVNAVHCLGDVQLAHTLRESFAHCEHRIEVPVFTEGRTLEQYLRSYYCNSSQLGSTTSWPPTLEVEYINLALIAQEKLPTAERQLRVADLSRKGKLQEALMESHQLDISDITNYPGTRKVIVVEGAPGVGKTTFAYKLCRDWAKRELLTDFWLVLYVPLRVPRMRLAQSIDDVLKYFQVHSSTADDQLMRQKYSDVLLVKQKHGRGVLFVLDGWDELRQSCRLPNSFFPRLIHGEFLPESSVLLTSRPGHIAQVILTRDANRHIEILGFTDDQVVQYIRSYFKDKEGVAQKLLEDLVAYPNVGSTCYVAINLTILCYVYRVSGQLPSTLADLYEQFVVHAVKRHFNRLSDIDDPGKTDLESLVSVKSPSGFDDTTKQILRGLGRLALQGVEEGDISFSSAAVSKACMNVVKGFDGFGLLRVLPVFRMHGQDFEYQFLHLTVQEYLAAYIVFHMSEKDQRDWLEKNFTNDSFDQVLKFFCGMDKFQSCPAREAFSRNRCIGTPFAIECVFEGQWEEACQLIAQETNNTLTITHSRHIRPYRALVCGYVMSKSGTAWHICWTDCHIGEPELKSMNRHLSLTALTKVTLTRAKFVSCEAAELFSKLVGAQEQLQEVTLDKTHLEPEILDYICKHLAHHKTLTTIKLIQNGLTKESSENVSSLLTTLPSLKMLELSGNDLGDDGCRSVLQAASKNTSLQNLCLPHCSISALLSTEVTQINTRRKHEGQHEIEIQFS